MFNIYGRRLPDADQIARNLVQLAEEDRGRARRMALRAQSGGRSCLFAFGTVSPNWWVSPLACSSLLAIGFLTRDWSWQILDHVLVQMGFY